MSALTDALTTGAKTLIPNSSNFGAFDPRSNVSGSVANKLLQGKTTTTGQGGFIASAANAFGSSLGQSAFNKVLGSVPKIQVDNSTNSAVRLLVDSVNSGVASFAGSTINDVSRSILDAVGINGAVVPADPNGRTILSNSKAAADELAESLISGTVDEDELPAIVSSLSAQAFTEQTKANSPIDISVPDRNIHPYARDLIAYAPKHNFMFMVVFEFQPDYKDLGLQEYNQIPEPIKFNYLCRQFSRPSIDVEYEELNMYNFHTKVAKRITYEPVQLKLYDDIRNSSMVFLEKYLKIRSPIARVSPSESNGYETQGMSFDFTPTNQTGANVGKLAGGTGSMGGLINENISVLSTVSVFHIFNYGSRVNKYTFINPKITQFDISDFDMDNGTEPSTIDIRMAYDSMFIETDIEVDVPEIRKNSELGENALRSYG